MNTQLSINNWLYQRIGLDTATIGQPIIDRAVHQRQNSLQLDNSHDYWLFLQQSPQEQQTLIEAVVVPETWFFRYPESFAALATLALKQFSIVNRPLRLLSAPCATGEEPYSMAMALFDAGLQAEQFKIDAIDISQQLIHRAQKTLYGKNSFRGESLAYQQRYFHETTKGYQLEQKIRQQVQFRTANLLNVTNLAIEGGYDFIFCRNVLIYFDVATQKAVLNNLITLSHQQSFLFVGPAEASLLSHQGFQSVGIALSFAFKQVPLSTSTPREIIQTQPSVIPHQRPLKQQTVVKQNTIISKPKAVLNNPITSKNITDDMSEISRLANAGRTIEAITLCQQRLKQPNVSANLFYWLGLLHDSQGQITEAMTFYRKALYLDPKHQETLAHLAMLLTTQGDIVGAKRLQARIQRG